MWPGKSKTRTGISGQPCFETHCSRNERTRLLKRNQAGSRYRWYVHRIPKLVQCKLSTCLYILLGLYCVTHKWRAVKKDFKNWLQLLQYFVAVLNYMKCVIIYNQYHLWYLPDLVIFCCAWFSIIVSNQFRTLTWNKRKKKH